jgi:hypothetical protein
LQHEQVWVVQASFTSAKITPCVVTFVPETAPQHGPARVERRFAAAAGDLPRGWDVAHENRSRAVGDFACEFVEGVLSPVFLSWR